MLRPVVARAVRALCSFVLLLAAVHSVAAQERPTGPPTPPPGAPGAPGGRPGGPPGGMPPGMPGGFPGSGGDVPGGGAARLDSATLQAQALRVFLDCQGGANRGCDRDFFVQELAYVNWMRDRFDAEVHLLVTRLPSGGGGSEYTVTFVGQKRFQGLLDTLVVYTLPNDADDRVRRALARTFGLGLARYVARTPIAPRVALGLQGGPPARQASPRSVRDPWNFWLYNVRLGGNFSGEQLVRTTNTNGSVSAARTTADWKLNLSASGSYNQRDFRVVRGGDTTRVKILQRAYGGNALVVRTLGDHWSTGFKASGGLSDFLNQDLALRFAPAIEYNVFPWRDATRRQLTALYTVGANHYRYQRTTIFNLDRETRLNHSLVVALVSRQTWGNVDVTLDGQQYLHDPTRNLLTLSSGINLRLGRGFALNLFGSGSRVRDQIYLPRAGQTPEEVLTQRQALQTNFRYSGFVSVSYTFGSIYNTIVNQRFGTLGETGRRFGFGGGGGGGG